MESTSDGLLDCVNLVPEQILLRVKRSLQLVGDIVYLGHLLLLQTSQLRSHSVDFSMQYLSYLVLEVSKLLEWVWLSWKSDLDAGVGLDDRDSNNNQEEEDSLHG